MDEFAFDDGRSIEIMSLAMAEQVANDGKELTDRDPRIGRVPGSPLANRAACVALVVSPRQNWRAIAAVVDTTTGGLVWVNPANAAEVTPLYLAAIAIVVTAESLQAEGDR